MKPQDVQSTFRPLPGPVVLVASSAFHVAAAVDAVAPAADRLAGASEPSHPGEGSA